MTTTQLIPRSIPQSAIEQELAEYGLFQFSRVNRTVNFLMWRPNPNSNGVEEVGRVPNLGWLNGAENHPPEPVFSNAAVAEAFRAAGWHPSDRFRAEYFVARASLDNPLEADPVDPVDTQVEELTDEETTELIETESIEVDPEGEPMFD